MRIGIVSERPPEAHAIHRAVSLDSNHHIIWITDNGVSVMDLVAGEMPDLILLNLPLLRTNALEVVRRVTARSQCRILVVTDSMARDAATVFDAVASGAFDAIDIPRLGSGDLDDGTATLLAKIDLVSKLGGQRLTPPADALSLVSVPTDVLVAIGASAGGPSAIATVLKGLPSEFCGGIVIVQHVHEGFACGMSQWLAEQSGRNVTIASEGDRPCTNRVLMAGGPAHLHVKSDGRVSYTAEPRLSSYRPSVDVFFQSANRTWPGPIVGVLLTGLGKDGALGLKALRDSGHHTIAQDEQSSAVYGMPKAAASLNAAVDIRPLDRIASRIVDVVGSLTKEAGCTRRSRTKVSHG